MRDIVQTASRQYVLPETLAMATICFADMIWTIIAVEMGIAREGNPIMAAFMGQGAVVFAAVKITSFMLPLTILEFIRKQRPVFIAKALRVALVLYVGWYVVGSLKVHGII